jgi:Uma2 family endonuclease
MELEFHRQRIDSAVIEQLFSQYAPQLLIQQLEAAWAAECVRRTAFLEAVDEQQKSEWINGEMVLQSPATSAHNVAVKNLALMLSAFVGRYELGYVGIEKVMLHLSRNNYEPDICFFKGKDFAEGTLLFPVPDLVIEVLSESTKKLDYGIKFKDYALHGVSEYWLVQPSESVYIDQYYLLGNVYELVSRYYAGAVLSSVLLPDFSFPINAVWDDRLAQRVASEWEYLQGKLEGMELGKLEGMALSTEIIRRYYQAKQSPEIIAGEMNISLSIVTDTLTAAGLL